MRINPSLTQQKQKASFKAVKIESFFKEMDDPSKGMFVEFTKEDVPAALKIFNVKLRPNARSFFTYMNLQTNAFNPRTCERHLKMLSVREIFCADSKKPWRYTGYVSGKQESGREQFEKLCKLMQKAVAKKGLKKPKTSLKAIKEFFTLAK